MIEFLSDKEQAEMWQRIAAAATEEAASLEDDLSKARQACKRLREEIEQIRMQRDHQRRRVTNWQGQVKHWKRMYNLAARKAGLPYAR